MGSNRIKKIHINIEEESNYSIFGLVSSEPDYRLCLSLNKLPGISLKSATPIINETGGENSIHFSRFSDMSKHPTEWVIIVSNRSDNYSLFTKLQNIDYLILRFNEMNDETEAGFVKTLKTVSTVNAVFTIDKTVLDKDILERIIY